MSQIDTATDADLEHRDDLLQESRSFLVNCDVTSAIENESDQHVAGTKLLWLIAEIDAILIAGGRMAAPEDSDDA